MNRIRRLLSSRFMPLAAAAAAFLLTLPALGVGLQLDDWALRFTLSDPDTRGPGAYDAFAFLRGDPAVVQRLIETGVLPWWTLPELKAAFLRPLTTLTHLVDYRLWPEAAPLMHLQSLLWLALLVFLVGRSYRRLIGPTWVAGLAVLLYGLDDARGYPTAWLANRNALTAATFGVAAILAHDRWRRAGRKSGALIGPVCLALAFLSGEASLGALAYIVAYAVTLEPQRGARKMISIAGYGVLFGGYVIAYALLGYGTEGSGLYTDPLREPVGFARALVERAPILLLGQWGMPYADTYMQLEAADAHRLWLVALGVMGLLTVLLWPLARGSRTARFLALGMLLSLVPIAATAPSNRLLFFVGFGAAGLLALYLGGLIDRAEWTRTNRAWFWVAAPAAVVLVPVHLVLAPIQLPLGSMLPRIAGEPARAAAYSVPDDPGLGDQDLVVVSAPDHLVFITTFWHIRHFEGLAMPRRLRALVATPVPVELMRIDARTLRLRIPGGLQHGLLGHMWRGPGHPMRVGDKVSLDGMRFEVVALTDRNGPSEILVQFDRDLEDASLRWVTYKDCAYVPLTPPAIGETVCLDAPRGPLEMTDAGELMRLYERARANVVSGAAKGAGLTPDP